MSFLPTFALKCPNKISCGISGIDTISTLVLCKIYPLYHHFIISRCIHIQNNIIIITPTTS
jgi:hypothetical protein